MGYAFISYSSKNQASAEAMRELFKKYHIDTWMAPNDIPVGSKYAQVIGKAVKNCTCLLLLLTDDSQNSPWVAKEVERAINYRKTIVPVQLEDIQLNDEFEMYISTDQIIAVRKIDESSEEIQKVLSSVIALTGNASVGSFSDDKHKNTDDTSSSTLKTIELAVWSPVNTDVYLHDKKHLVMRIDHNAGFDYKSNTINVSGEFNLLFVSKGFEKTISFDTSSIDDRLEYHLDAILSKKEIVASYDRDEAIEQIEEEATAYAYAQLSKVGTVEDIPLLLAELKKLSAMTPKSQHVNYFIACCASALGKLAVKFGKLEDIRIILEVYEKYEAKKSYGYMFEPIIQALHNEEGSISNDGVKEAPIEKPKGCFPIDILTVSPTYPADAPDSQQNVKLLNEILKSLNIAAHVTDTICGNSVTRYEVELHKGTHLRQLRAAEADIALQLGVTSVRVVTLLHELFKVGIEIPNHTSAVVSLRDVMNSPEFENTKVKLPIAVGKDIDGNCIVGDISQFPHLLIGGMAGSGKTVFLDAIILSLLHKSSPEDVRLILIDSKMIEHEIYNGLPHLMSPVIKDSKQAIGALQWAVMEMTRRYKAMSDIGVRNLDSYNSIMANHEDICKKIPRLVIIIDELSQLMHMAAKQVEEFICRIAQLGRAAGIHLIIATQEVSTDVITGLMKANIPSRIAFTIPSPLESRIILDQQGAEKLACAGDMLYAPVGSNCKRVQGCFVSWSDVENVVSFIKANYATNYDKQFLEEIQKMSFLENTENSDVIPENEKTCVVTAEMLSAAVNIILDAGQVSISLLQRRLHLGYMMSAHIVDKMEELGIVGGFQNGKPREILISKQQWETLKSNLSV